MKMTVGTLARMGIVLYVLAARLLAGPVVADIENKIGNTEKRILEEEREVIRAQETGDLERQRVSQRKLEDLRAYHDYLEKEEMPAAQKYEDQVDRLRRETEQGLLNGKIADVVAERLRIGRRLTNDEAGYRQTRNRQYLLSVGEDRRTLDRLTGELARLRARAREGLPGDAGSFETAEAWLRETQRAIAKLQSEIESLKRAGRANANPRHREDLQAQLDYLQTRELPAARAFSTKFREIKIEWERRVAENQILHNEQEITRLNQEEASLNDRLRNNRLRYFEALTDADIDVIKAQNRELRARLEELDGRRKRLLAGRKSLGSTGSADICAIYLPWLKSAQLRQ